MPKRTSVLPEDQNWYKDAIIYEVPIKSFFDTNGDGIGDIRGLTQKLDYLQSLGVTAIWVLPFYPSPLRDDGYDIADYHHIHSQYGTLRDFRILLREAHARGIRVITELVLNHTSDSHSWFKKSRRAKPGSALRDFYVWSDTPDRYRDARIIFTDFETSNWAWDPVARAYYWHRFYSHQPDLNFDNPAVVRAMFRVVDYWFEMGVDGLRLDAVPYLYEREGTNCENLPETYQFLEKLRAHVDKKFRGKMLLAEANQWPEDAVAYFGDGNRCHMAFHFPLMPRLFMGSWMEDRFPIVDIFEQTPAIDEKCQWALFLRNHDELTLEMVSDEERDFMYRVYARDPTARINLGIRRRLAPLLSNNRRRIELMNILLFSLPGTPVLYYGDEIGMGDNHYLGDRNGVRTPMQWNGDRNAGFSRANPQQIYLPAIIDPDYHFESINVENQERNQSSLLWWMRRVITMRKRFKAFGRGSIEFLNCENAKVLAFIREFEDEHILVVVNLSRFSQVAELDLSRFAGYVPEEVVSGNKFPRIKTDPYLLTLGFHNYYWFSLSREEKPEVRTPGTPLPEIAVTGGWDSVLEGKAKERLEKEILPAYVYSCRWFGGKSRVMQQLRIAETIPIGGEGHRSILAVLDIRYLEGANDHYLLPLTFSTREAAEKLKEVPAAIVTALRTPHAQGVLHDAVHSDAFRKQLLRLMSRRQSFKTPHGELAAYPGNFLSKLRKSGLPYDSSQVLKAEQSNTSVIYGQDLFLKLFRRLDEGINPELEVNRFLTESTSFTGTPSFAGAIEYRRSRAEPAVLVMLQSLTRNQGDAWSFAMDSASGYIERVLARESEITSLPAVPASLVDFSSQEAPPLLQELVGGFSIEMASLLGRRTAQLHEALASGYEDPKFAPEAFTLHYQRSLYHGMRTLTRRVFSSLQKNMKMLPEGIRGDALKIAHQEKDIIKRFSRLFARKINAMKIRIHGDYHLGQVLYTGNDFVIIDFEGEPARTIGERRLKRSPLRDVAGMIRSFHYPTYATLFSAKTVTSEQVQRLIPWADLWYRTMSAAFLHSYLTEAKDAPFVPSDPKELELMLDAYLLEKAVYEVGYELNNRPDWVIIPLHGIGHLLGS